MELVLACQDTPTRIRSTSQRGHFLASHYMPAVGSCSTIIDTIRACLYADARQPQLRMTHIAHSRRNVTLDGMRGIKYF